METTSRHTDLVNDLKECCRGEGLDKVHSLVVLVHDTSHSFPLTLFLAATTLSSQTRYGLTTM